jgi:hypothetical protein
VLGRYAAATAALDAARVAAAGPGAVNDLVSGVGRGHPGR